MRNLKKVLLFFVLQYSSTLSLSWPWCDIFAELYPFDCEKNLPDLFYTTESSIKENPDSTFTGCPPGQSLISRNDLTIMIDYIAKHTMKIKESLVEGYYQKAVDVNNKHVEELNKYQEKIEEQPKHLKHILQNIEDERISLEPIVQQIAVEIEEGDAYAEQTLSELNNRLQNFLTVMNAYEAICQINIENLKLVRTLKHRQNNSPLNEPVTPFPICGSLKEFHNKIIEQLTNFQNEYITELLIFIEDRDNNYSASVASHNKKLKDIAMRQYKGIMYDILKLQDDFIHFKEHLNEFNIAQTLDDTKNNLERIEELLNDLEEDVHEYGRHCVESNYKRHSTTSIPDKVPTSSTGFLRPTTNMMKHNHKNLKIIDELTQLKIEEIKKEVLSNLTGIFKALDEHLNYSISIVDPDSVNNASNSEDIANIKRAQEALIDLESIIPPPLFDKIQKLRQNSQEILAQTEKAKENFDLKFEGINLLP